MEVIVHNARQNHLTEKIIAVNYTRKRLFVMSALAVFLLPLLVANLSGCRNAEEEPAAGPPKRKLSLPVEIGKVVHLDVVDQVRAVGNLQADERVLITAEVKGQVTRMPVEEGTRVRAGDLLAEIDPREYQLEIDRMAAELAVAEKEFDKALQGLRPEEKEKLEAQVKADESRLDLALKELERAMELVEGGFIAESELDTARDRANQAQEALKSSRAALASSARSRDEDIAQKQAQVESAGKRLDVARLNLSKATIVAPFDGVIISKKIDRGAFASAGTPIVEMIGSSRLKAVLEIPQSYRGKLDRIRKGEFLVRELGLRFERGKDLARRVRVIPDANIYSGNIRVQIDLSRPDPSLFPGLTLEAKLSFDTRKNVLHVPAEALVITEQGTVVFVMKEGKAHRVPVKAHKERGDFVEIEDFTHQLGPETDLILRGSGAVFPGVSVFPTNLEPKAEPPVNAASKESQEGEARKPKKPPET